MSQSRLSPWVRRIVGIAAGALLGTAQPGPAAAYDATTTLAGLTEQAALSSRLHRRLIDRLNCSLGLFEPLRLDVAALKPEEARSLHVRLQALDAGQGYVPELLARQPGQSHPARRQHALGWLAAGTVLEAVPAARQRHHFFEPRSGRGLFRPAGLTSAAAAMQSVRDGMSTTRQLLAGAAVDGTGLAAPDWIDAPTNDLGVTAFLNAYERAVLEKSPAVRESALAEALLAAGAVIGVLEQMGDPAHVRNDLPNVIDGAFQRYVAEHYGRAGVPAPGSIPAEALTPRRLRELFSNETQLGLADRTMRRFYSSGSLPGTELGDIPPLVGHPPLPNPPFTDEHGLPVAEIGVPSGWPIGASGYLGTPTLKHLAAWERRTSNEIEPRTGQSLSNLRFSLDEACYADYATTLLPEIGRYAQVALDYLFRGELRLSLKTEKSGPQQLVVRVAESALGSGTLTLLAEKPEGSRQVLSSQATLPTRAGGTLATLTVPEQDFQSSHRLVVLFRGRDHDSEPLITSAQLALPGHEPAAVEKPETKPAAKSDADSETESETKPDPALMQPKD
jgi:hypothetical protein